MYGKRAQIPRKIEGHARYIARYSITVHPTINGRHSRMHSTLRTPEEPMENTLSPLDSRSRSMNYLDSIRSERPIEEVQAS